MFVMKTFVNICFESDGGYITSLNPRCLHLGFSFSPQKSTITVWISECVNCVVQRDAMVYVII